jgi:predicted GNAT family N-acyltransferase
MHENLSGKPSFSHAEPVLAVADVLKTVNFYKEVLRFPDAWTYGEPVNHGGVSWNDSAFIQFSLNVEWANQAHRESVWIRVKNLDVLYDLHTRNKAEIVVPYVKRPWAFAEYTIKDLNGYYLTFAEPINENKPHQSFPKNVRIESGKPDAEKLTALCEAVGWRPSTDNAMTNQISHALFSVVARDTDSNQIIGCAFLLGDHKTTYYVKDVIVHPDWQAHGIGTSMMKTIMQWLEVNGTESATVGLFTGDHLARFYKQFGFTQACGMYTQVRRVHS